MTLEILGPDGVVEGGGNQRRGGWCGVIGSLEKALELEVNPTRIPQVFTLSPSLSLSLSQRERDTHTNTHTHTHTHTQMKSMLHHARTNCLAAAGNPTQDPDQGGGRGGGGGGGGVGGMRGGRGGLGGEEEHHGWTPGVIVMSVFGVLGVLITPVACSLLSARVKEKYD
jgi:hypothetical protein